MMSTPWLLRMRCSWATSASRGTLSSTSVSGVNKPAIISGSAAFLAPEIGMVPLSVLPPTIRIRSMPFPAEIVRSWVASVVILRRFDGIAATGIDVASDRQRQRPEAAPDAEDRECEGQQYDALRRG